MFVPATMSEVDIFVFEDNIDAAAQTVAQLGVMHLLDAKTLGQWGNETDAQWTGRVNQYTSQAAVMNSSTQSAIWPRLSGS